MAHTIPVSGPYPDPMLQYISAAPLPPRPSLAALLLGAIFGPAVSSGTAGLRGHFGTPPRRRRGRPGVMRPGLRVKKIAGVLVGRPRHASSTV